MKIVKQEVNEEHFALLTYSYAKIIIKFMKIEYDPNKNLRNIEVRQLPFDKAIDFDFEMADVKIDNRHLIETRYIAVGPIQNKLYTLVFTTRGEFMRVISLRNASRKERKQWLLLQIPL